MASHMSAREFAFVLLAVIVVSAGAAARGAFLGAYLVG